MKILITGGTGLVGNAIQSICKNYDHEFFFISSKDYDLLDLQQVREMFQNVKPDFVIHLAGCVGGLFKNMNYKVDMYEKNNMINYNVLKCCHDYRVQKVVSCLSTCIFPDKTTYPINETMLHNGPPHNSNDAYAYAKRMLEIQCQAYRENYGDKFMCVIPTNIYGPHDNFNLEDAHVVPALIHKCYLAKKEGIDFVVRGSGTPLRQFIYSEDLAKLIILTLFHYDEPLLILSVPEKDEVSIGYVAKLIADNFDYGDRLVFDPSFSDGQFKKTADNSKLCELISFDFLNIESGIQRSVEWFIENYESARH
jgi:GDP-L-fucose synthase